MDANRRFDQLDSVRGLAATTVVLSHILLVVPSIGLIDKLKNTPLHIFWSGHEAVILFFILSGFVLSLPYYNNKELSYKDYLIRRICRIYIPYAVSIIVAVLFMVMFSRMGISDLSGFFNLTWVTTPSKELIWKHALLIDKFKFNSFNPVVWSLIHEMRISIIFPVLMYFLLKYNWKRNAFIALLIPIMYFPFYYVCLKILKYDITVDLFDSSSYFLTVHYVSFFMLGALLAKYRISTYGYYLKLNKLSKIVIFSVGILSYTYAWWFFHQKTMLHLFIVDDWAIAIGSLIFIFFSLNSKTIRQILLLKPIHFVGKISYSLYLIHITVLFTMVNILYGKLPIWTILIGSFVISFMVSTIMYYAIERPSIKVGKTLTKNKSLVKKEISKRVSAT